MFSLKVSGDLANKFKIASASLDHLDEALKQFSKYLRQKVKERFQAEGPGWAKLANSTQERLEHSFTGKFTVTGKIRKSAQKNILAQIEKGIKKGKIPTSARSLFKKIVAGNLSNDPLALRVFGFKQQKKKAKDMNAAEKLQKKLLSMAGKSRDAKVKALEGTRASGKHKLLGKLASTIKSKIEGKQTLKVYSSVAWAHVHDDGGSAGKGAQIPQREFMRLDEDDLEVLATLIEGQVTENID